MMRQLFVENDWYLQEWQPALELLVGSVVPIADFGSLSGALTDPPASGGAAETLVILDPGIPGVCRLETVHRVVEIDRRARIVVWTATRDPAFLASCLIDGALAAVPKSRPKATLGLAVERARAGRYTPGPETAQWLVDFLLFLRRCQERHLDKGAHIWTDAEIDRMGHPDEWIDALEDLASGADLDDDRWFSDVVDFVRDFWLEPRLRSTLIALAVSPSRSHAARLLGKSERTVDGYCSGLAARLIPSQYPASDVAGRSNGLHLVGWLKENHAGCELPPADHVVDRPLR